MPAKHVSTIGATRHFANSGPVHYKKKKRPRMVIILEDLSFEWTAEQISNFRAMWEAGISLPDIAAKLGRDADEVALLVMHEARQGRIEPREGGWAGGYLSNLPPGV